MPVYVSSPPAGTVDLIAGNGDLLVTGSGDQLVVFSFNAGAELVDLVAEGVQIARAYVGPDLVYLYDPVQIVTMVSGEDQDLSTLLTAASVNPAKPVIVNMADGEVLGGVGAESLTLINLSSYVNITINLDGQWQGQQGADAIRSDQNLIIQNAGEIAGDVSDVAGGTTSNITIVIGVTGKILSGGGNGGTGGKGGNGDDVGSWTGFRYTFVDGAGSPGEYYYAATNNSNSAWSGVTKNAGGVGKSYFLNADGYRYNKGSKQHPDFELYQIRRALNLNGNGGSGGIPGVGEGYNQARTDGDNGSAGTYRSGTGGKGGNGGAWGIGGGVGSNGSSGLYYSTTSSGAVRAGSVGIIGQPAGFSIVTTGTVIYQ